MTQLPDYLLTSFLELCDPFRKAISGDISQHSWEHISELSKSHGVTPFLFHRTRSLGIKLPEQIEKEWLGYYLYQLAEEQKARRQIKELKKILDPEGIPFILLKGASAILRLYPQPGLRTFVDLDILIPDDKVEQFRHTMTKTGYKPLATRNSPEDEELRQFEVHLDPLWKGKGLMVEPHLNILMGRGEYSMALPEIWRDKEEKKADGISVAHLNKEHFIIQTLLHCARDLSEEGFIEIKGLIDVLYALKAWKLDWLKVEGIAQKWSVEKHILPLMATLNYYWQTQIPLAEKLAHLDISMLVSGGRDRQKQYYTNLPASYIERLLKTRGLPDITSQIRYLFHLFFPTRENLRWRYGLSSEKTLAFYYFLHLILTTKKFLIGLWHQSRLKTQ